MAVIATDHERGDCQHCSVSIEWTGETIRNVRINYCPKHEAAPEMYKLLRDIYKWLRTDQGRGRNLPYKPPWVDALIVTVGKAGAKTDNDIA